MGSRTITRELRELIHSGEATVGSYLPSTRALASRYGVSLNTVHAAMKELEGLKLVECRPRRGAVVVGEGTGGKERPTASTQVGILLIDQEGAAREYDWRMEWSWKIIHTLEETLFKAGLSSMLLPLQGGEAGLEDRLDQLDDSPAGVMVLGRTAERAFIEVLERRDIPWVSINRPRGEGQYNYVSADNQEGGRAVGRLFARLGWERLLVLGINHQAPGSDVEKVTGLFQGYLELGLSTAGIRVVDCEDVSQLVGYRTIRRLLEEGGDRPQGIFTVGDMLALGAIHALRDEGIRVPADVGVVGSTGLSRSAEFDPPLTVVQQPMEAMGRSAGEMLAQMIREGIRKFAPRRIGCPLILRESVVIPEAIRGEFEISESRFQMDEEARRGEADGDGADSADEGVGGTLERMAS